VSSQFHDPATLSPERRTQRTGSQLIKIWDGVGKGCEVEVYNFWCKEKFVFSVGNRTASPHMFGPYHKQCNDQANEMPD